MTEEKRRRTRWDAAQLAKGSQERPSPARRPPIRPENGTIAAHRAFIRAIPVEPFHSLESAIVLPEENIGRTLCAKS